MAEFRLLHPPYRRVPWKNGLGSTLEIATDAAEAGAPWSWRLSFADVPARAAFSSFPGIDRHLAVLEGDGLVLERGAARIAVPREGTAFAFAGEDAIVGIPVGESAGEPLGVRVIDANLMLDRRRWTGSLEVLRVGAACSIAIESELVLIHARGPARSAEINIEDESHALAADSTVVCGGTVTIVAADATLVVARIAHR